MASVSMPVALSRWWTALQAPASIYGTILGASVMAAGDDDAPVDEVAVAVVVTLVIFWAAERWSQVLGANLQGESLDRASVRKVFATGWPMVQASYVPVLVMVVAWLLGADNNTSVNLALATMVALLVALGALAGRRAGLSGWALGFSAAFTGMLGAALVVLKAALH